MLNKWLRWKRRLKYFFQCPDVSFKLVLQQAITVAKFGVNGQVATHRCQGNAWIKLYQHQKYNQEW